MNIHKNARLTFARRLELVMDVLQRGLTLCAAAAAHNVSVPTVRKWVGRYLAEGEPGLADRSSRPKRSPRSIAPSTALAIVELRRRRLTQARIAASLGVSKSTVGRVLARAGLSRLRDLEPSEPVVRYEHEHPGDLVHIDTKKLGRIERPSHRVTGNRRDSVDGAGWEFLFVASTITRVSASPTCTPMSAKPAPCSSSATPWPTSARWACASDACSPTTARRSAPRPSPKPAGGSASSTASPDPTGLRPTARPSASSSRRCANGPTAPSTTTPRTEPPCLIAGSITTTGIALTRASGASRQSVAWLSPETTS